VTPNKPSDAELAVRKLREKFPTSGVANFEEVYTLFKEVEATLEEVEGDPHLYGVVNQVRADLMDKMEVRATELGKAEDWAYLKKFHETMRTLRPLLRARNAKERFVAYRDLTSEQHEALKVFAKEGGIDLKALDAAIRKDLWHRRFIWAVIGLSAGALLVSRNFIGLLLLSAAVVLWRIYEARQKPTTRL